MLRVRDASGTPVPQVRLSGVFEPTGRKMQKTQITASGLCLVHWPRDARRSDPAGDGGGRVGGD